MTKPIDPELARSLRDAPERPSPFPPTSDDPGLIDRLRENVNYRPASGFLLDEPVTRLDLEESRVSDAGGNVDTYGGVPFIPKSNPFRRDTTLVDSFPSFMRIAAAVADERIRQISVEGHNHEHDDRHANGELAQAAATYAIPPDFRYGEWAPPNPPDTWPFGWPAEDFNPLPDNRRRELVIAAALIFAEIERLDRIKLRECEAILATQRSPTDPA